MHLINAIKIYWNNMSIEYTWKTIFIKVSFVYILNSRLHGEEHIVLKTIDKLCRILKNR